MKGIVTQYLLGIAAIVVFAYVNSYFPQYTTQFFIAYMVVMGLVMFAAMGRQAGKIFEAIQEIQRGEPLYKIEKTTIAKLKERDLYKLKDEMSAQWKTMMLSFVPIILVLAIFAIPQLRDSFMSIGRSIYGEGQMANFVSFLFLYGIFYVISVPMTIITRRKQSKEGTLTIANSYIVTEKGIIVDERLPIKFPVEGEIKTDNKRKFVEIQTSQSYMGTTVKQKIRLYTPEPSKLARIIREHSATPSPDNRAGQP